jgi:predicted N-acetyltransferase YhbS
MLTSLDPTVLRARALDHGGRPMTTTGLTRMVLGGAPAVAANGVVLVAEHNAEASRAAAEAAGMADAGTAPLMALELDCALAESPCAGVERAIDRAGIEEVSELVRAAFGISGSTGLRPDLPEVPGADAWLLRDRAGHAMATLVATTDPDLVGIWSMATAPDFQRRGVGAGLLRAVLGHYALEGATRACLISTPAGEPFYRSVGFRPVEHLQVWQPH